MVHDATLFAKSFLLAGTLSVTCGSAVSLASCLISWPKLSQLEEVEHAIFISNDFMISFEDSTIQIRVVTKALPGASQIELFHERTTKWLLEKGFLRAHVSKCPGKTFIMT